MILDIHKKFCKHFTENGEGVNNNMNGQAIDLNSNQGKEMKKKEKCCK